MKDCLLLMYGHIRYIEFVQNIGFTLFSQDTNTVFIREVYMME